MKLRINERCPLHGRRDCCGRAEVSRYRKPVHALKFIMVAPGVKRFPDGREVCSKSALRHRKDKLIKADPVCAACGQTFTDYSDIELAHRKGKGSGGGKHDSRMSNLALLHARANREQGSMDLDIYLANYWKPHHCGAI